MTVARFIANLSLASALALCCVELDIVPTIADVLHMLDAPGTRWPANSRQRCEQNHAKECEMLHGSSGVEVSETEGSISLVVRHPNIRG